MIIPDINLLLYAYDSASPFHKKAKTWWEDCLSGAETIGLPTVVVFGFARIVTQTRILENPMTPAEVQRHVHSWLAQPVVRVLGSSRDHIEKVLDLMESVGVGGNLLTDAQIAAMAGEHGAVIHSNDTDFVRFSGVRWFNPITGHSSSKK